MYAFIRGTAEAVSADAVIIDNNGIGYRIFVPSSTAEMIRIGEEYKLYTHFQVREDAMLLFGFLTEDDLEVFRMLLSVNGIGPKGALGVLSVLTADDLRFAVLSDDAASVAKAPGIGKKTAQKVILELKDKFSLEDAFEKKLAATESKGNQMSAENDAILALTALGYSGTEASKAVRAAAEKDADADSSALISAALRILV